MNRPTRTLRPHRDYSRLEQHRATILGPRTWGVLLGDSALPGGDIPLGTSGLGVENCEVSA